MQRLCKFSLKSDLYFLFYKSESMIKLRISSFTIIDVMSKFVYRKRKRIEFAKCCQNILIKKDCHKKSGTVKMIECKEFPNKH